MGTVGRGAGARGRFQDGGSLVQLGTDQTTTGGTQSRAGERGEGGGKASAGASGDAYDAVYTWTIRWAAEAAAILLGALAK